MRSIHMHIEKILYYIIKILDAHPCLDLYMFFYRNAMINFCPSTNFLFDSMLTENNQELSRMFDI